ncbi:FadR/GntR family transcriptional regulator [Salimicrobium halophilum]|uniref:DNA-binding transcriptional regulator, FadR family n=1 Tax=Salimicrobium halophilum TaxID=86666 RepID=A0A1G8VJZ7_9BACI|nr:GntR family transcriptional regulator [Salimicrobium halophilum]SDJ65625.1 DNA-binding transcriptional regulator, FadR family [Salimicrobium halophilum]
MARSEPEKTKVYEGVLQKLKEFIDNNGVKPGDKLPSERELSEQLKVGRSSIREALRALELLGLIETRRGEGTFLKEYEDYHMVELLSTFILNRSRTPEELRTAKNMVEKEMIILSMGRLTNEQMDELMMVLFPFRDESHDEFFRQLFTFGNQHLLFSIWHLLTSYLRTVEPMTYTEEWHQQLMEVLEKEEMTEAHRLFNNTK